MIKTDPAAAWERAVRRGDFARAWRINDLVLARRRAVPDDLRLPYHLRFVWDGRPFDDRAVLVRCYHGLGDTLQFARFLPELRRRARHVTLEAQPELVPLLRGFPGVDRLIPFDVDAPLPPGECSFEIMELAHALRLAPWDVGAPPYLAAPDETVIVRRWVGDGMTIGLCCRGGAWDQERWVPEQAMARALPEEARIVQLQPFPFHGAINPEELCADVIRTAALVSAVSVVVTVDSMVAHLAGVLGRPVALLLKHRADWRWMGGRDDSPWYPSMRLFRQALPGRWDEALAALTEYLRDWTQTSTWASIR